MYFFLESFQLALSSLFNPLRFDDFKKKTSYLYVIRSPTTILTEKLKLNTRLTLFRFLANTSTGENPFVRRFTVLAWTIPYGYSHRRQCTFENLKTTEIVAAAHRWTRNMFFKTVTGRFRRRWLIKNRFYLNFFFLNKMNCFLQPTRRWSYSHEIIVK